MRENFTDEEWTALLQAPMQGVMAICLADRVDPVAFLQEVRAGIAIVGEEIQRSDLVSDLVRTLAGGISAVDMATALEGDQLQLKKQFELLGLMQTFKNGKEARDYALEQMQKVAALLETKVTGAQAAELKQWLMSIAVKVAESQREGGIMGIGSSRISDKENEVLKKIADVLGVEY